MADDRAAQLEEIRFAKRQQWAIATAAVTLLAAVFGIARTTKLDTAEKSVRHYLRYPDSELWDCVSTPTPGAFEQS
jgi:hypothetical protein